MAMISQEQFARIAERAGDVERRTYTSGVEASAQPLDFDQLADDLARHGAPGAQGLLGAFGKLGGMLGSIGGMVAMGPGGAVRFGGEAPVRDPAAAPGPERLAMAERRIGRALPEELRQLYAIADGGFGPGGGLFALDDLVARYLDMTGEPFGPLDQDWPANLLPLFDEDPALLCLDLDGGAIVIWDPEEIEDEDSEDDWQRSFIRRHASLGELMGTWLDAPTWSEATARMEQDAVEQYRARQPSPVTGFPMDLTDPRQQAEAEIVFLGYSDALRSDFGLPEAGWEDEIRRRHGLL